MKSGDKNSLQHLMSDQSQIEFVKEDLAVELEYLGSYADIPQTEEQLLIDRMKVEPWRDVVRDSFFTHHNWLYRIIMDPGRIQFLDMINYKKNGRYLDIGSGWGQVSIPLAKQGEMVALDLTKNRLELLDCIAQQEDVILQKIQGNFLTIPFKKDLFDLVIFNGSLEWIGSGRDDSSTIRNEQLKALIKANNILTDDGKIYIGIENSLGAKYLAGTQDDHTGLAHIMYLPEQIAHNKHKQLKSSLLSAKTWSLEEYYELFKEAGLQVEKTYACFPDYKLIRRMVDIKEINQLILSHNLDVEEYDGSNGETLSLNVELRELYKTMAKNGVVQYFCPSYAFVLKRKVEL